MDRPFFSTGFSWQPVYAFLYFGKVFFPGQMLNQILLFVCFSWHRIILLSRLQTVSVWRWDFPGTEPLTGTGQFLELTVILGYLLCVFCHGNQ